MLPPTSFTLSRCRRPCRGAQCHCWRVVASSPSPFRSIYRRCEDVVLFGALYTHHLYNRIIAVHFARRGWGEPNSCFTLALFVRSLSSVLSPHWYAVDIEMETNFTFPFSSSLRVSYVTYNTKELLRMPTQSPFQCAPLHLHIITRAII